MVSSHGTGIMSPIQASRQWPGVFIKQLLAEVGVVAVSVTRLYPSSHEPATGMKENRSTRIPTSPCPHLAPNLAFISFNFS